MQTRFDPTKENMTRCTGVVGTYHFTVMLEELVSTRAALYTAARASRKWISTHYDGSKHLLTVRISNPPGYVDA